MIASGLFVIKKKENKVVEHSTSSYFMFNQTTNNSRERGQSQTDTTSHSLSFFMSLVVVMYINIQ